ncbi:hypothetical protein D3C71_1806650 [compost metagenome]
MHADRFIAFDCAVAGQPHHQHLLGALQRHISIGVTAEMLGNRHGASKRIRCAPIDEFHVFRPDADLGRCR